MYASVFGNVTVIVNRIYATQARYHHLKGGVKEFIRFHHISNELYVRVLDSFERIWKYHHGIEFQVVSWARPPTSCIVSAVWCCLVCILINWTVICFQSLIRFVRSIVLKVVGSFKSLNPWHFAMTHFHVSFVCYYCDAKEQRNILWP